MSREVFKVETPGVDSSMLDKQTLDEAIESLVMEFVLKHKLGYKASVRTALIKEHCLITNCSSRVESIITNQ